MSVEITCYLCGIAFSVPYHWHTKRQEDQGTFYCPNGHRQSFITSTAEKLRQENIKLTCEFQAKLNDSEHTRLVAEKERDKAIKEKRKVERRVAHGVCPCCNQTFADLSNHMITQHKEFRLPGGKTPKQIVGTVQ
jgi:hypothetical protein